MIPHVTFRAFADHPSRVYVHLGDVQRHFEDTGLARTQDLLAKVAISEFGIPQDEARAFAAKAMTDRASAMAAAAKVATFPGQLAAAHAQIGELKAQTQNLQTERAAAAQQLVAAGDSILHLRGEVARLSAPAVTS